MSESLSTGRVSELLPMSSTIRFPPAELLPRLGGARGSDSSSSPGSLKLAARSSLSGPLESFITVDASGEETSESSEPEIESSESSESESLVGESSDLFSSHHIEQ